MAAATGLRDDCESVVMPNGFHPQGDDQTWKRETDKKVRELERQIQALQRTVKSLSGKG